MHRFPPFWFHWRIIFRRMAGKQDSTATALLAIHERIFIDLLRLYACTSYLRKYRFLHRFLSFLLFTLSPLFTTVHHLYTIIAKDRRFETPLRAKAFYVGKPVSYIVVKFFPLFQPATSLSTFFSFLTLDIVFVELGLLWSIASFGSCPRTSSLAGWLTVSRSGSFRQKIEQLGTVCLYLYNFHRFISLYIR